MKVWCWRAAVLLAALALWEAAARMLNPILYVGPSRLPGALGHLVERERMARQQQDAEAIRAAQLQPVN